MDDKKISSSECARLQTLMDYQILDTVPEVEYDDVTFLASLICGTPIAMVSLSDQNRQWFKSNIGLGGIQEVQRPGSFCDHAIRNENVFIIPDTWNDIRFANAPIVIQGPQVRFYAGAPIRAPNGHILGTVCVLDRAPRELSENQILSLQALARQVSNQLQIRKTNIAVRLQLEQVQVLVRKLAKHEETLIQAAKMSSLGEMASGLAHEVNNPLAIIMGYNKILEDLAVKDRLEPEKVKELTSRIEAMGVRISAIISNLRFFAKDTGSTQFTSVSLHALVAQTLDFCRARFASHQIALEVSEIPKDLMVTCQKVQMSRLLMNLLSNARDAVMGVDKRWIRLDFADLGEYVSLSVIDNGKGIAQEHRAQVMEPFFTTKPPGTGVGLGLSVATGIAQAHGGRLQFDESAPHTRFVVTFPKRTAIPEKKTA